MRKHDRDQPPTRQGVNNLVATAPKRAADLASAHPHPLVRGDYVVGATLVVDGGIAWTRQGFE
jgi:hypothetical protein